MMLAATALQSTVTSGPRARRLAMWMARAKVSLPLPGSPTIRIGRRLRAALAATASAVRKSGAAPTSCSSDSSGAIFSDMGASSPCARRRSAWAASASSMRSGATGLARKSLAPARIASTASAIEPPSASTMIGRSGVVAAQCGDQRGAFAGSQVARTAARTSRPCGPCSRPSALSAQAAPTTLQPARAAIAVRCRRSLGVGIDQQQGSHFSSRIAQPPDGCTIERKE